MDYNFNSIEMAEGLLSSKLAIYNEDGEFITTVDYKNDLAVVEIWHKSIKTGYGLFARCMRTGNLLFVGNYDAEIAHNVKSSIAKGLIAGAEYFKATENESVEVYLKCRCCNKKANKFVIAGGLKFHLCKDCFDSLLPAVEMLKVWKESNII